MFKNDKDCVMAAKSGKKYFYNLKAKIRNFNTKEI